MHIGVLSVVVRLHSTQSLKDKRQIIKSLIETTRQKFNISMAEVDNLDDWGTSSLGISCVANDKGYVNRILDKVLDTIENNPLVDVTMVDLEMF